ncbi:P-type ATPase, A domain containing protein [Trema orientale]|uniref:P-type ATPase, A domain containing protein n=1 Tax=Trema orientale TaxID=63057 RepID=A0A2P5ENQ8_TREOI|nr:P-type ATPase, A domain containing protein [Trema orientale]
MTLPHLSATVSLLRSLSYVTIDIHPAAANDQADDDHRPAAAGNGNKQKASYLDVGPIALSEIVRFKNLERLTQYGGVIKVVESLETDANVRDTVIIVLAGIKQLGWKDGWFNSGSIIFVVFLVLAFSAVSNFNKSGQFQKLLTKNTEIRVEVITNGRRHTISIYDIVVGDVVFLKIGDQIPANGLYLEGHSLKVDESSMTGESDHVKINAANNPFPLPGTKVTDGFGTMLVTSVSMNTAWGEMMSSISRGYDEETPLQARLKKLTSFNGKVGISMAAPVFVVLMTRYFVGHTIITDHEKGQRIFKGSRAKFDDFVSSVVGIVTVAVTITVVAIPEGLPLGVTFTLIQ